MKCRCELRLLCGALLLVLISAMSGHAQFPADGIQFLSQVELSEMGGGRGSDLWGWTDPETDRDYALFGRSNGTSFVDVTDPVNPVYLGDLPTATGTTVWRDIKVYNDHAFIVSDQNGPHGMQVFDLTRLRGLAAPMTFAADTTWDPLGFRSAHNIVINEDSGYAYIVGSTVAAGGLYMVDISNPLAPTYPGEFAAAGYTHDAQAV
ncbi:MAG: choice-of-anchor B family protein, partial [Planctomycetota bacterium]